MKASIQKVVLRASIVLVALIAGHASAQTAAIYVSGHISNVTFAQDYVMIMVDSGLPDNCAGTAWGWMKVAPENKAMTAFVIGLWMRGDAAQTNVTVYTGGIVGGYCRVDQIDPVG